MAHFKFNGPGRVAVSGAGFRFGKILELRVPLQDGSVMVFRPRNAAQGFSANEPLEGGARHRRKPDGSHERLEPFDEDRPGRGRVARDLTDPRALRMLRNDPRFAELP